MFFSDATFEMTGLAQGKQQHGRCDETKLTDCKKGVPDTCILKRLFLCFMLFFLKRPFAFCLNTQGGLYKCQWVQPADL